ncbi:MAG: hypothetical protein JJ979_16945 [Roseibium sp.]|nr:hypothetical protein [Roseibium sp.]
MAFLIDLFAQYGDHIVSFATIIFIICGGLKKWFAWLVGLCSQVVWTTWAIVDQNYGLFWLISFNVVLYTFFHFRWLKEHREQLAERASEKAK